MTFAKIVDLAKVRWLIGGGLVLFGAVAALIGFAYSVWSLSLTVGTMETEGTIVALEKPAAFGFRFYFTNNKAGVTYVPVVRYLVNGEPYTCRGMVAVDRSHYGVGEQVRVLYRSHEPSVGYLSSAMDRYVFPLSILATGGALIAAGMFLSRPPIKPAEPTSEKRHEFDKPR